MPVSALKYYLHDGSQYFRIELLGKLTAGDIAELSGCWRTARTMTNGRVIVVDSAGLKTMDEAGRAWMEQMLIDGAVIEDQDGRYTTVPGRFNTQETVSTAETDKAPRRKWGKLRVPATG
jgi:hypothetical protein